MRYAGHIHGNSMSLTTSKKVLFLITKSNWGEKVSKHFRKTFPSIFVENGDCQSSERIKKAFFNSERVLTESSAYKVYSIGTMALSRPTM